MNRQKRILIVDENLPYLLNGVNAATGGASVQTYSWLKGFEDMGYKITIGSSLEKFSNDKYPIVDTTYISSKYFIHSISEIFLRLKKIVSENRPDFIYVSTPFWSNIFLFIVARIKGIAVVQRISNDNVIDHRIVDRFGSRKSKVYLLSLKLASVIICQNDYQYKHAQSRFPRKKVFKITNPFLFQQDSILNNDRFYIAWVGIFQPQKNLKELYNIASSLPSCKFKVAGSISDATDSNTKEVIKTLQKLTNVEFVGLLGRKSIIEFLSKSICLLNTSHYEGFSNTYLEAFSVGTPVVTRRVTDPDLIVHKYKLGKSVEVYSELSLAIAELLSEEVDHKRINRYLSENHNPELLCRSLIKNLYENN